MSSKWVYGFDEVAEAQEAVGGALAGGQLGDGRVRHVVGPSDDESCLARTVH